MSTSRGGVGPRSARRRPGGVTVVRADGRTQSWRATPPTIDLRPTGIALTPDGAFLIANLGGDGGVWRLDAAGCLTPVLVEVDGRALPPAIFVIIDAQFRTWIFVSTRLKPRHGAWRDDVADGFVVQLTSVAFGGPDRRTVYLGTLHGSSVYRFRTAVTGARPPHWGFSGALAYRSGESGPVGVTS